MNEISSEMTAGETKNGWNHIDLRGRNMLHPPWLSDPEELKENPWQQPPETLLDILGAYVEEGGSQDELYRLLNSHMPSGEYFISAETLENPHRFYSLEFYFYFFTFCKILLNNPGFFFNNGDKPLDIHHYILEKGSLKFPPWKSNANNLEGYLSLANIRAVFVFVEEEFQLGETAIGRKTGRELAGEVLTYMNQMVELPYRVDRAFFDREEVLVSYEYLFNITSIFEFLMNASNFISKAYRYGTLKNHHLAQAVFLLPGKSPSEKMKEWVKRTNNVYDFTFFDKKLSLTIAVDTQRVAKSGMFGQYEENCFRGIKQAVPSVFSAFMEIAKGKKNKVLLKRSKSNSYEFYVKVHWGLPLLPPLLSAGYLILLTAAILSTGERTMPLSLFLGIIPLPTGVFFLFFRKYCKEKNRNTDLKNLISTQLGSLQALTRELIKERDNLNETVSIRTEELRTALEQLKSLDREKTNFIANVSHELRTPLTLIATPLEELREGQYGESIDSGHPIFEIISRNTHRLQRQINQLLDFARLDQTNNKLTTSPVDIVKFCSDLVMELNSLAESKGLYLRFQNRTQKEELCLEADPDLLETLLMNLIGNALKFTKKGGAEVIMTAGDTPSEIKLSVKDTGIGFTEEEQEKIFDRFFQAEEGRSRRYEGAGLGLALVKQIVKQHNWDISVKAVPGGGACFNLKLPVTEKQGNSDFEFSKNRNRAREMSYLRPPENRIITDKGEKRFESILLVDDNPDMAALLSDILSSRYQTHWSPGGREALEKLSDKRDFALIICDMMMPGMSGLDFRKKYLEIHPDDEIPFIFLTALADQKSRNRALETGGVDYITKPFMAKELKMKVENLIKSYRNQYSRALRDAEGMERLIRWNELAAAGSNDEFMSLFKITRTEKKILEQLKNGLQDKEIAKIMAISPRTVSTHLRNLYKKTGTQNRVELLNKFYLNQ